MDGHYFAIIRALADEGVAVSAVEKSLRNPGAATQPVWGTFPTLDFTETHPLQVLKSIGPQLSAYAKVLLFAINASQVETVGKHVKLSRPLYEIFWPKFAKSVMELQRKDSLKDWSGQQGLAYPRSLVFINEAQAREASGFRYPVIIKPVRPLSSLKTLITRAVGELSQRLRGHAHDLPHLGQESIAGDDEKIFFGALILDRGKVVHTMADRKIADYPPPLGKTSIAETIDNADVLRLTEQFFCGSELSGPVSLELKLDHAGKYWVIEPTVGRTDFSVKLCISAGFNQQVMEYQLAVGLPMTPPSTHQGHVWYDTERDPMAYAALYGARKPYSRGASVRPFRIFERKIGGPLAGLCSSGCRLAFAGC